MSENISLTESFLKLYSTNQQNIVLQYTLTSQIQIANKPMEATQCN